MIVDDKLLVCIEGPINVTSSILITRETVFNLAESSDLFIIDIDS